MPIIYKICFGLLVTALMLFFMSYYHFLYLQNGVFTFSKLITQITAVLAPSTAKLEPQWEQPGFIMYEERAVLVLFVISATLCMASYAAVVIHSLKNGMHRLFIHISLLSFTLFVCILYIGNQLGLQYA